MKKNVASNLILSEVDLKFHHMLKVEDLEQDVKSDPPVWYRKKKVAEGDALDQNLESIKCSKLLSWDCWKFSEEQIKVFLTVWVRNLGGQLWTPAPNRVTEMSNRYINFVLISNSLHFMQSDNQNIQKHN